MLQALPNISDGRNVKARDFWRLRPGAVPRSVDLVEISASFDLQLLPRYALCFDVSCCNWLGQLMTLNIRVKIINEFSEDLRFRNV